MLCGVAAYLNSCQTGQMLGYMMVTMEPYKADAFLVAESKAAQ